MKTTKDATPPFGAATGSAARFGCKKGIFGKYFMATVNDNLVCTHMHRTTRAAIQCARLMPLAAIRQAIQETRNDHADVIAMMPNEATTAGQRALKKKHGTPRAFARAVVNAIGEISVLEANVAIRKYLDEWKAA